MKQSTKFSYSVCDPKSPYGDYPQLVEYMPVVKDGFILWEGEKREIRDIHKTLRGIQIELLN